jgi:hypothetical protein
MIRRIEPITIPCEVVKLEMLDMRKRLEYIKKLIAPNELLRPFHDRMPVIIPKDKEDLWLDPKPTEEEKLLPLLAPYPAEEWSSIMLRRS